MDYEQRKRREFLKIIATELLMVLSVIAVVVVATLAAMGFFISSEGGIEQSGLLQLHSLPTGATVELDGDTLFSRTNLSRTMPEGEHTVKLSREDYDTWEKNIKIYPGVLTRIYYPRLFLQNRQPEDVMTVVDKLGLEADGELEFLAPSLSRSYILYMLNNQAEWVLLDLRGDEVKKATLDLTKVLPGVVEPEVKTNNTQIGMMPVDSVQPESTEAKFGGEILEVRWSKNDERVLVKVSYEGKQEWILVNLREVGSSLNLTRTFGMEFERIEMIDDAASQLFALENQQLRKINVQDGAVSKVLLSNVTEIASYGNGLMYVQKTGAEGKARREIGVYRDGERAGTALVEVTTDEKIQIALTRYYGEDYMCYFLDDRLTILYGILPSYTESGANLAELKRLVADEKMTVVPEKVTLSPGGEFLVARAGRKMMVTNMEMGELYDYEFWNDEKELRWLDASLLYAVVDGEIEIMDFDGTNRRKLAQKQPIADDAAVMITSNERWIYYLSAEKDSLHLVRERIRN